MPRMKNVNIFVDVDLTLVNEHQRLLPNAVEGLLTLREAGCRLFLWSTGGADYCRRIAERYEMATLFDAFLPKPDLYIDDMPSTIFKSPLFDVRDSGWQSLADHIAHDLVDPPTATPRLTQQCHRPADKKPESSGHVRKGVICFRQPFRRAALPPAHLGNARKPVGRPSSDPVCRPGFRTVEAPMIKPFQSRRWWSGRAACVEPLEGRALLSTFHVLNLGDAGSGSLRQAILDANAQPGADEVVFADGLQGTIPLTTGQLEITGQLTIAGPGADVLAVSGGLQSRVFRVSGGAVVSIADLTITQGTATGTIGEGGGILNAASTLTLTNVTLSGNRAIGAGPPADGRGGAVANIGGGTLNVVNSHFNGNTAIGGARGRGNGGAILNLSGHLTVRGSTFTGNQALGGPGGGPAIGGAISTVMAGANATITDSTFSENRSVGGSGTGGIGAGRGGGVYNFGATLTVADSAFLNNVAQGGSGVTGGTSVVGSGFGGGLFSGDSATLVLSGSLLKGNRAIGGDDNTSTGANAFVGAGFGGGMINIGIATVTDSVFDHNEARGGNGNRGDGVSVQFVGSGTGGGIHVSGGDPSAAGVRLTLRDVAVRHNRAVGGSGNTAGTFVDAGIGGGLANNAANNNAPVSGGTRVTAEAVTLSHNHAVGGAGGGDALGGGVANLLGGVLAVTGATVSHNHAKGGDGGGDGRGGGVYNGPASHHSSNAGAPTVLTLSVGRVAHNHALGGAGGGDGLGGGAYNDLTATLRIERSVVTRNHANGDDDGGDGLGGGIYNLGLLDVDPVTSIFGNHASTNHDDRFG